MSKLLSCSMVLIGVFFSSTIARGVLITYNNPGDLAANFNQNHFGAGPRYNETASGGIGNTRAISMLPAMDQSHASAVYKNGSFDFSTVGSTVTVSHFFLRQNATNLITNFSVPQIGILTDNTELFGNNEAGNSYASLRLLSSTSNATDVFIQTEIKAGDGTRQSNTIPGTATLTAGNWYKFSTTLENLSATQVKITGALEDWGTTGTSFVSTILQLGSADPLSTVAFAGTDLVLGDSTTWAGYRAFAEGGDALLDNFSAVPEPASAVLALLACGWLTRRRH